MSAPEDEQANGMSKAMKSASRPRAALFFYEGFVSIQPSVLGAAIALQRRGYDVDLYIAKPRLAVPLPVLPPGVRILQCFPLSRLVTAPVIEILRHVILRRSGKKLVKTGLDDSARRARISTKAFLDAIEIPQFALYCAFHRKRIDLAIAFDSTGLLAMDLARYGNYRFIYWSLEIQLLSEATNPVARMLKRHELHRLSDAKAVVVQSAERRALLEEDVTLVDRSIVIVPNGPFGYMPDKIARTFFTSRFGLSDSKLIVLHAGMISPAARSLQLAASAATWSSQFALVMHERIARDMSDPYLQAVSRASGERVVLSLSPVPFEEIDLVYAGAHIGLICYESSEANLATAWASSGKLGYYLRHGLPVIIVTDTSPSILAEWNCGVWVREIENIAQALTVIAADYAGYSGRARHAFAALFDFDKAFDRLITVVERSD